MTFESELKKGNFVVSKCQSCGIVWPPSDFCNRCLGVTVLEKTSTTGVILGFSRQDGKYFCLAEIDGSFGIVGRIMSGIPQMGRQVKIQRCGMRDGSPFFEMSILE